MPKDSRSGKLCHLYIFFVDKPLVEQEKNLISILLPFQSFSICIVSNTIYCTDNYEINMFKPIHGTSNPRSRIRFLRFTFPLWAL